ncbi:MAG: hypothetical protein J0J04_08500 [Microbacterium sp.]|uniref:hypothetical protein n=1 Tax=Microbacterium sp. TaxID=51671 RepID=UPI001AC16979|nr:hypothetical protein [Microbacterium sp.]MBN9214816.1 hypothetical protein [Microbacterium sp.]
MALMICTDTDLHPSHRWEFKTYDNFCPGLHAPTEGEWLVRRFSPKGGKTRPHFFLHGERRSICGYGTTGAATLRYDPNTMQTTEDDPRLGELQFRRPCGHCIKAVVYAPAAA